MTALEAVKRLCGMDHAILDPTGARKFWEAVGLDPKDTPLYQMEHRPNDFKGAHLKGCTHEGEKRMAVGADELAESMCRRLGVEYMPKFGRGSRLRECCGALYKHFGGE